MVDNSNPSFIMLNREITVQECDATDGDRSNAVGSKKKKINLKYIMRSVRVVDLNNFKL